MSRKYKLGYCLGSNGYILMIIHKITHSVDYNWWLKRLDNQLNEPTNQTSIRVPKVVMPTNKKT